MQITLKICIACVIFLATSLKMIDGMMSKGKMYEHSTLFGKTMRFLLNAKLRINHRRLLTADSKGKIVNTFVVEDEKMKPVARSQIHKESVLHDTPYLEELGSNDFLVMRPEFIDPFVTAVPNHIYYNIEKPCVNWLDDCSLNGIRQRLLRHSQTYIF